MVSKARVAPLKQNSKKSQMQGACADFLCSVFGQQHPPKCLKNARILHGGGFYQCLTPCKFKRKSIQPVKNCGIVKANAFLSQHDFFGVRWKEHYGE